jgi:leucyl aminopeptidase
MIKNYKPEYIVDIATLTGSSVGIGYEWRFVLIMKPF